MKKFVYFLLIFWTLFFGVRPTYSEEFTSTNYKVLEPVMTSGGSFSSSTSFQLFGAISQIAIGTSTATGFFSLSSGFLYFPFASSPVVSATAGSGQVSLSWSTSQGFLGWTVSGYNVGQSTTPGGPYTYSSSLGSDTSSTRTGLTNGTVYYFVIRPEDAFGNSIATSTEVSATPVATVVPPSGGGGGGGGGILPSATRVILKGRAYPDANLTIFKDGSVASTLKIGLAANFEEEIFVNGGIYTFSLYAADAQNRRSLTTSFTTNVPNGLTTTISNIIVAPTISADKSQVKYGNDIIFFGAAYPQSQINVVINSEEVLLDKTNSDKFGLWTYNLDSGKLEKGEHTIKGQAVTPDTLKSPFSESLAFRVGDNDILAGKLPGILAPAVPAAYNKNGDINNDKKVNIVDFSIMLYFWKQSSPSNPYADINRDGIVNLFDFSIMLFWWTG